ncbi:Lsr2 family DNA-binding protein [Streptomyces synnematoformans]|uniref:Lsr2 DNA-binding domain-containing protein n=1 Tax=Streptomyces synnematoformans TaxID=415721 RepID=A0ABN2XCC1_9ACTN
MTINALRALLDEEQPHATRPPAPRQPRSKPTAKENHVHDPAPPPAPKPAPPDDPQEQDTPVWALLAWGDEHVAPEVRDQAADARTAITALRARRDAEQELTAIAVETETLEQRLAELRAREAELAPPKTKRKKQPLGYPPADVRAWAAEQGIEVSPVGRVPKAIVEQWRAATGVRPGLGTARQ